MKKYFLKLTLILFILPVHTTQCTNNNLTHEEEISLGVASAVVGATVITVGVLKACNIPITSMEEVSLCLQNRLNKENLKKLQLGRKIIAYSLISGGLLLTLSGIARCIIAVKAK